MTAHSSPSLLESLLECRHDGILITDSGLHITQVNQVFEQATGYPAEALIGHAIAEIETLFGDSLDPIRAALASAARWSGEVQGQDRQGKTLPLAIKATPVRGADGRIEQHLFAFSDLNHLRAAEKRLLQLTHFDRLTELPNRVLLIDRLEQAIAQARRGNHLVAVIFLDIDHFKTINDRHGHPIGDRLLRKISDRLRLTLRASDTVARLGDEGKRPGDTVARVGGDEFVVLATGLPNMDILETIVNRILTLASKPCLIDGRELTVSASLGVTVFPFDAADAETLIRHADQAMYQAKQDGRNRYHLFDAERDQQAHTRRQLLGRLRQALQDGEFRLYYQPKVNLRNGRIIGLEALLRWQHPERGLVPPGEFLPHVEHDDLIVEIGQWVTREALRQMAAWRARGLDLGVSINIAARQLLGENFVEFIAASLAAHPDLPKGRLELEILESSAIDSTARVRRVMQRCEAMGIRFALDDFGTGYASLTYLKEIPAEVLKIDQSFIRHILDESDDLALVEGIIGLASAFRRTVVAEGVETAEQGVLLMRLGCDLVQGYGIARPMPAEAVPDWVAGFKPDPQWSLWADASWDMVDFPLLVAQHDHFKWVSRVAMYVEGTSLQLTQDELHDHHQCRFGHWYYGQGMQRYGELPEFQALEAIHRDVHQLGPDIVALRARGEIDLARQRLPELLALKDQVLEQLGHLQAIVAGKPPG